MIKKITAAAPAQRGLTRYGELANFLKQRIYSGEWQPGTLIPAESELAVHYKVALGTMRQAIQMLVEEKLLQRHHGRGTSVSNGLTGNTIFRFFRFRVDLDSSEAPSSRISGKEIIATTPALAPIFDDRPKKLLQVERCRILKGIPRLFEKIWLPLPAFANLTRLPATAWTDRLYPLYGQRCGVIVLKATDRLSVRPMIKVEADSLGLKARHPGLVVERRSFDIQGHCVEYRQAIADAQEFDFDLSID
jgi:GntR family transcriptional regulator